MMPISSVCNGDSYGTHRSRTGVIPCIGVVDKFWDVGASEVELGSLTTVRSPQGQLLAQQLLESREVVGH